MRDLVMYVASQLVEHPENLVLEEDTLKGEGRFRLLVGPGDMGKMIGREGRIIKAVRTVLEAAAAARKQDFHLDVEEKPL